MDNGWIKLHRKILENPISKKPTYAWLWIFLLLRANHKETKFLWNGQEISIKEGQILTGRKELSKETGIPETTIERALAHFEKNGHQIGQQKTTKYRVITILNWKQYQNMDTKADNKRTTNGHIQECKNEKNNTNTSQTTSAGLISKDFIHTLKARSSKPSPNSSSGLLASEIYEWSGKRLKFPMLMRLIKLKGERFIRMTWAEVKDSKAKEPYKLLMYKIGQTKMVAGKIN